jgi:uncharacterized protein (TIGR02271 family)
MAHEKVVAVYDTVAHAEAAVKALKTAGYLTEDIGLIQNDTRDPHGGWAELGFWRRLFGQELDLHDAEVYGQAIRQGGAVVAVRVSESEAQNVINLLNAHMGVDVQDGVRTKLPTKTEPRIAVPPPTSGTAPVATLKKDEEVVRLAEEQLNVGKRQVELGKTRIRRIIIEKPVEANVTLHEEHLEVMRRVVADQNTPRDIDWTEQTIEVTETAERPVINKTVRMTEEVVIKRKGSDHVETVHDTVRQQQLEVEKLPVETIKK